MFFYFVSIIPRVLLDSSCGVGASAGARTGAGTDRCLHTFPYGLIQT